MLIIVQDRNKFLIKDASTGNLVEYSKGKPYTRDTLIGAELLRRNLVRGKDRPN